MEHQEATTLKRLLEQENYQLRNKYNEDDLALDEVVKRWSLIPDSRKRQKSIAEAKWGSQISKAKKNLDEIERGNRILQIELELAQMKVDEHQKFIKLYDIKSAKDIQQNLGKIKKKLSTDLAKLTQPAAAKNIKVPVKK